MTSAHTAALLNGKNKFYNDCDDGVDHCGRDDDDDDHNGSGLRVHMNHGLYGYCFGDDVGDDDADARDVNADADVDDHGKPSH
jgi:hypothetical protein